MNGTLEHVVKQSFIYSYLLSQPFAAYVDAYPALQNKILQEAEQLQYGEHGESVRILQHKLSKLSYYDDQIDGELGILTEHALKKFQKDYGMSITGEADSETIHAIIKAEKKRKIRQIEKMSETIYPGMHSEDVKIIQDTLKYFGYYEGEIDGIYGPLTQKALEVAEEEHDLELTKGVTQASLQAMYQKDKDVKVKENVEPQSASTTKKKIKNVQVKSQYYSGVIQTAKALIGTPYVWGGTAPGGFDCSGFIQYVYETQSVTVPRTVSDMWNFASGVSKPSVGDLVFFETYKPGPSHMGIYIGDGKFIHAGESRGVEISALNNSYWKDKYLGAKRVSN
ncbi:C40 family peptidase [Virgibacillus sp. MG-45]|uniref:C40 family peptidase n=1 Tax=Virgibacillus sp. MG-45 TaxID=3102791 RepID=UPI002ED7A01E